MSEILPVVTIETANGPVEINEHDFDPSVHKLFGDSVVVEDKNLDDMTATELRKYAEVHNIDIKGLKSKDDLLKKISEPKGEKYVFPTPEGKYVIVNGEGTPIDDQIFDTQEDAEKAIA